MDKNNYIKYKKFVSIYYVLLVVSSAITLLFTALIVNKVEFFHFTHGAKNLQIYNIIYIVFICVFAFLSLYAIILIIAINSFIYKLEKIKTLKHEEFEAMEKRIKKHSIALDIISFNKHLSYDIYTASKD
ncbi:Uncharacterised protein [Mycoplasmopsis bovigenitalium]|uniref:Uncharacterized protein n=1 Tax=Mycoplasmopsis bovigenitalium TaxID=2112 RepID=A0A449A9K0_9BACT|nr:hypothetical protein [Mycoplasmopsis bovigenitalium]VEU60860.1 Uncharacterised protein [Mycoplasmopsis bovigenitalium]